MVAVPTFTAGQLDALLTVGVTDAQIVQAEDILSTDAYPHIGLQGEVARSATSVEAAQHLLALAAEHLERREPLPAPVADFLASALRQAASVPPHEVDKLPAVLALALNLTARQRRPAAVMDEVGGWIFRELSEKPHQNAALVCSRAASEFGVSPTTASTYWRRWRLANPVPAKMLEPIRAHRARETRQRVRRSMRIGPPPIR